MTQHTQIGHITSLARIEEDKYVRLDKFTVRSLELIGSMNDGGSSLLNVIDRTISPMAVSYTHLARYIQEVLEVPVGIVVSTWGGSKREAWMSRESIKPFSSIDLSILDNDAEVKNPTTTPCVPYHGKIAPMTTFAVRGFLWYQGESNRDNADLYQSLMPAFVAELRANWGRGELPFYFVQIAPFNYEAADGTSAARLREVQLQNMKDISCLLYTAVDTVRIPMLGLLNRTEEHFVHTKGVCTVFFHNHIRIDYVEH